MKQLVSKLKSLLKAESLVDIIIFGSVAKNKTNPRDIDVALLVETGAAASSLKADVMGLLGKGAHIQVVGIRDYDTFLWITLIREGFSVKHNAYLHDIYGIEPVILFKYSLKEMTPSKKVMFERAIKNFAGIQKLSNRVVLVPIMISGEFSDFLRRWNIDIDSDEYGLLPLVRG